MHVGLSLQVLQLTAMPALAVAVVESFLTMLDAEEPSPLSSVALIVELEFTAAPTMKMQELDAQVDILHLYNDNSYIELRLIASSSIKLYGWPDSFDGRIA